MTIIELFPWLMAFCVAGTSAILLKRLGMEGNSALVAGIIPGVASWLMYFFLLDRIGLWLGKKQIEKERLEVENRQYQTFDPVNCPRARNFFYECVICGNVVPSTTKKDVACACRNVQVFAKNGRIEIQNYAKTKLFSL